MTSFPAGRLLRSSVFLLIAVAISSDVATAAFFVGTSPSTRLSHKQQKMKCREKLHYCAFSRSKRFIDKTTGYQTIDFHLKTPATPNAEPEDTENNRSPQQLDGSISSTAVRLTSLETKNDESLQQIEGDVSSAVAKKRSMELMWCTPDYCKDVIRERVVGDHNHMEFDNPATGQVCYVWNDKPHPDTVTSILILVKPNDKGLLKTVAEAVRQLTSEGIQVLLRPELIAELKQLKEEEPDAHLKDDYDDDEDYKGMVTLFEPHSVPGFGVMDGDEWKGYPYDMDLNSLREHRHNKCGDIDPDLICTVGGDGLLMYASSLFPGPVPPILCVAGGSLGFLTPFAKHEMVDALRRAVGYLRENEQKDMSKAAEDSMMLPNPNAPADVRSAHHDVVGLPGDFSFGLENRICLSMRMRLDCRIIDRDGNLRARFNVLNEVTVDRGTCSYLANLECFVDNVHLTTVQADGIIFATPTGSTAYSMAAGGSVVHPAVPAILVTPICPHVLSFRSMVFPDHVVLRCYVPEDARSDASVAFDGKHRRALRRGDSVQIQMSVHPVPTINRSDHSADWLYSLKSNFNFNSRARQKPL